MSLWKRPNFRKSNSREPQTDFDILTFGRLDVSRAPDFTRAIMGRLGYMQATPRAARRHRIAVWGRRTGLTLAALLAIGIGWRIHDQSDRARTPLNVNVPAALERDIQRQQRRFNDVIQTIRDFTPRMSAPQRSETPRDLKPTMIKDDVIDASPLRGRWV